MHEDLQILVIDDNDEFRTELTEYIKHQPGVHVVGEGRDGREAISLAQTLQPDIILLDISMPGVGGIAAARKIKEESPHSKIVFITIHEEQTYHTLASMIGVDGFICKNNLKQELPPILKALGKVVR